MKEPYVKPEIISEDHSAQVFLSACQQGYVKNNVMFQCFGNASCKCNPTEHIPVSGIS